MENETGARIAAARRKGRCARLYNILFPTWMFYLLPTGAWLILLPANFIIDSLVLWLAMRRIGIAERRDIWKRSILRIWGIGFLSDFIGASLTFGLFLLVDAARISWDIYLFPGTTLFAIPGVVLSGIFIYVLDKRYAFKKCALDDTQIQKLSLALAFLTAPYAMLIPLYG